MADLDPFEMSLTNQRFYRALQILVAFNFAIVLYSSSFLEVCTSIS